MSTSNLHLLFGILCLIAAPFQSLAADTPADSANAAFPPLEQAQAEISKLKERIAVIEAGNEKELTEASNQINRHYSEKLETLKNEQRDKFESAAEFTARQDKYRDELMLQRDTELAKLNVAPAAKSEIVSLKNRIKALSEHRYIAGAESIEAELGAYDAEEHQFAIKLRSKSSVLRLKLNGTIPLQEEQANTFKKQWQTGLLRPEAIARLDGELVELALVNAADNSRWIELKTKFFSPANLQNLSPSTLNTLFQTGRVFKDCPACPEMVVIPAGNFVMGAYNEEKSMHRVTIRYPFAMGKTEVTQGEWKAVMGSNPSYFKNCGDYCPVEQVSWDDAKEFIRKLNIKTGKQYRLPSEAEWEYACRAGIRQEYCGSENADDVAWYHKNSGDRSHPAGQKQANEFGLFDMSGNVWEWLEDSYHADYNGAPIDGTAWQGNGAERVMRGGSWNLIPELVRASFRSGAVPSLRDYYYGFRLARMLP